jgi:hypothetical protein
LLLLNALHELVIAIVFRVIISFVHVHHPHLFLLIVLEIVIALAAILFSACFGRREDTGKASSHTGSSRSAPGALPPSFAREEAHLS